MVQNAKGNKFIVKLFMGLHNGCTPFTAFALSALRTDTCGLDSSALSLPIPVKQTQASRTGKH